MTYADIVGHIVAEVTAMLDGNHEVTEATALLAEGSIIDSLDLVNLIVAVEIFCGDVELLDEDATVGPDSPFRTVASLARHALRKHAAT